MEFLGDKDKKGGNENGERWNSEMQKRPIAPKGKNDFHLLTISEIDRSGKEFVEPKLHPGLLPSLSPLQGWVESFASPALCTEQGPGDGQSVGSRCEGIVSSMIVLFVLRQSCQIHHAG